MRLKNLLLDLFFPSFCLHCQKLGYLLCENCYHGLEFYFLQNKLEEITPHFETAYLDQLQIIARFNFTLQKLVKALKYKNSKNVAPFLAKMLWRHLLIPEADLITFVPLHPRKLKLRGYNQCQEIALELAKLSNIPAKNLLEKKINNQAQAQIKNQAERLERMANLFAVREKYQNFVKEKKIILLDDILTTGATLNAASQALKKAGAKKVFGLIIGSKME